MPSRWTRIPPPASMFASFATCVAYPIGSLNGCVKFFVTKMAKFVFLDFTFFRLWPFTVTRSCAWLYS